MSTPIDYLPEPLSEDTINKLLVSIGLPRASSIVSPKVTAQYHAIYRVKVPPNDKSPHTDLILRVSGNHLPKIKTDNEVGVMSWVSQHTSIPVPDIVAYSAATANPLGHEYTLLSHCKGDTLSEIYPSLTELQLEQILDQLIDVLEELHKHEWYQIGGLRQLKRKRHEKQGKIVVSRVLDETFWQVPDIVKVWPPGSTVDSLNIGGPYRSYVTYITAHIRKYIKLINNHQSLKLLHNFVPRLEAFMKVLCKHSSELNNVKLRLAHKDLHFANMLYDVASGKLTAILDWEFSGVVPMTKWNPRRAFLWNGRDDEASGQEKQRLMDMFTRRCEDRGLKILADSSFTSPLQESMQKVVDLVRAITEVAPRGQRKELVQSWVVQVSENLSHFGV